MNNTSRLGLFKIVAETSVAAGVRRIEAVTGMGVLGMLQNTLNTVAQSAAALKLNQPSDLPKRCMQLAGELKEKDHRLEQLNAKLASMQVEGLFSGAKVVKGVRIISASFSDALRGMCDKVRDFAPDCVAVLAGVNGDKASFAAVAGKDAQQKGAHAGKIVKAVAQIAGGNGGGRPDSAMAGAKDVTKIDEALAAVEEIVSSLIAEK